MERLKKINKLWLIPIGLLLAIGVYYLPPVHSRLSTRVDLLRTRIIYFFNPPSEAVFTPGEGSSSFTIETALVTARAEIEKTLTPAATSTPRPGPTATRTVTPEPLPAAVNLPGVVYVDQHERWNYCGPANITMALNFWGWKGNRDDVARVVKPGSGDKSKSFIEQGLPDKNVMPYELVDFVNENTDYRALMRYGGDEHLIKSLLAAGFPVIVEKGYYERDYAGKIDWLGHYLFTTGYDDARGGFIVQDAYLKPGKNLLSEYDVYQDGWRSFNYLFMVVYPPEKEADVMKVLGPWTDESWAAQHALEIAEQEIISLGGNDLFFAWFNKGTSHVALQEYVDAGHAYDQSFLQYAQWDIKEKNRPFRMMWYQTGPYFAYFYSGRYQDVVNLADTTLNETISTPSLEESLLWRGRAYFQLGNTQAAIDDYRAALKIHVNWGPAVQALQDLGLQP
jgi:tetratricopeptide (TPR) repeat protein